MKIKKVLPKWTDINNSISGSGVLEDRTIAYIYGAIKQYGSDPEAIKELKEYIKKKLEEDE